MHDWLAVTFKHLTAYRTVHFEQSVQMHIYHISLIIGALLDHPT